MTYNILQLSSIKLSIKEIHKYVKQWHFSTNFLKNVFLIKCIILLTCIVYYYFKFFNFNFENQKI